MCSSDLVTAQLSGQKGHLEGVAQQQQQGAIEVADRDAELAKIGALPDDELKRRISKHPALKQRDWSPEAFRGSMFNKTRDDIVKVLAFDEAEDVAKLVGKLDKTDRAKGKTQSTAMLEQAERLAQKAEAGTPKKPIEEEEEEFFGTP